MDLKRVLIKISGESLAGNNGFGLDEIVLEGICKSIKELVGKKIEVAIVVGGGNIWRGKNGQEMDRSASDHMGMLATVINGVAMQTTLEKMGIQTRLQTAIEMKEIAEPYIRRKAVRHLEKGRVVIFAGGTGNPFFTTDTCAALRAAEIDANAILLAKNVDGVYDSDPNINKNAKRYDEISYAELINKKLRVIDLTAASLCMDTNIPIYVFDVRVPENIIKVVNGEKIGTIIK